LATIDGSRIQQRKVLAPPGDEKEEKLERRVELLEEKVANLESSSGAPTPEPTLEMILDKVQLGANIRGPLIPTLVPKPGQTFEVVSTEASDNKTSNQHVWKLMSITTDDHKGLLTTEEPNLKFAQIEGDHHENKMGFKTTMVSNNNGDPLFNIRLSKHIHDPMRWSWSFRIAHPFTDRVLFTINKDWFGKGLMWSKDEWRIYRGRKSDNEEVYYGVGTYLGYGNAFYRSQKEYKKGDAPIAKVNQNAKYHLVGAPDLYTLQVQEGEDTALLLATAVIMDMTHEQEHIEDAQEKEKQKSAGPAMIEVAGRPGGGENSSDGDGSR
jgi:hypothetical protein